MFPALLKSHKRLIATKAGAALVSLVAACAFLFLALLLWRWAAAEGVYRFMPRHLLGAAAGLGALTIAIMSFLQVFSAIEPLPVATPETLTFLAPVQQAGNAMTVQVGNVAATEARPSTFGRAWPAVFALVVWLLAWLARGQSGQGSAWEFSGGCCCPGPRCGCPMACRCCSVLAAFLLLHVLLPALQTTLAGAGETQNRFAAPANRRAAGGGHACSSACSSWPGPMNGQAKGTLPESVLQQLRVADGFATGTAKIHWQAERGETLPLLFEPAVLTHVNYPKSLKLEASPAGARSAQQLVAQSAGTFDIEVQYQLQITKLNSDSGFVLPVPSGLINRATLSLVNLDVDVFSPQAVSVQRSTAGSNTVATLVLAPGSAAVGWKPRSRDVKNEKPVFYAELSQLYVPSAGVVEGVHQVAIRPAQGELSELIFTVPAGATITDVNEDANSDSNRQLGSRQSAVAGLLLAL